MLDAKDLRRSRVLLREIDARERDFVSVASHQLLTPLALLRGYLSMLLSGKLGKVDKRARVYLKKSLGGVDRMTKLVKLFLMMSRLESGNVHIEKKKFDLYRLAKVVAGELEPNSTRKKLKIMFEPSANRLLVNADKNHSRQVLTNILDNAIKYTPKGAIGFSAARGNGMGYLSVTDTGIGIDRRSLPRIFEKFYFGRGEPTYFGRNKPVGESHGIGLYTSRLLLSLMDGTVTAQSRKGKGSKFTIGLPLAEG